MPFDKKCVDESLPFLTPGLPGVGGAIKRFDEDFFVEEIPRYEPCGDGTHTYFTIEKRGMPTLSAIRLIAGLLNKRSRDIGYAGLKDAHGVTRQTLSIEHVDPERVRGLEISRIKILSVSRHTNKLKLGHLAGNRFAIKIRGACSNPLPAAAAVMEVLSARGVPNYFGPQRFGARGDNADVGLAVLRGDYAEAMAVMLGRPDSSERGDVCRARELFDLGRFDEAAAAWPRGFAGQARLCRDLARARGDARQAWRAVDHTMRRLYLSAVQSALFNRVLAARISSLDRLEAGDIAWKHRNGASFRVEDVAAEQPRCDAFEISPTGPLFGKKMMEPAGLPGEMEAAVLGSAGIERTELRGKGGGRLDGARRPLRVPLEQSSFSRFGSSADRAPYGNGGSRRLQPAAQCGETVNAPTDSSVDEGEDERGRYLLLRFSLPPGAYATSVTREVCKNGGTAR